jgi:dienelactone hydrolase
VTDLLAARRLRPAARGVSRLQRQSREPSEQGLYRDARAALAFLESQGVAPEEVVVMGLSVGSGPAVQLASETRCGR